MQLETEFNPSRIRKCRQDPSHANQPISYICLSPTCKGTARLICGRCLRGDQHRKHQIALINRFVQPFSRLCLNSYQTGAREKYQSLNRSVLSIQKSFNRAEGAVKGYFDDLRKIMIEPIKTICSTYTSDMAESAIRILESDFNDNQEVDSVSQKILFLLSVDPAMFESAMTSFQDIQTQCVKIFNDYNERIGRILEGMKEKLTEIKLHDIGGGDRRRNVVLPRKIERIEDETKNIQQPKTKTSRIESDTAPKVQDEILRRVLTRNNGKIARRQHPVYHPKDEQKPFGVKAEQSSSGEDEQQAESQKIFCEEEGQEYKPDSSQQNQKAQGELRTQTRLQEQKAAETSSQAGIYSDSPQQDIPFIIRSEQDLRWRQSVNYHKVTTLVVENISESPNFIEKILPQFTSLKVVRIYDPFICTGTNLTKFFDCLPRTTQRICLSCHNEFSQECITTLHKRRMGQIRQLEYFFQVGRDLQRVDENLYFRQQEKNIRIQPLRLRTTNSIFEYFPKIRNIWLPIKNYSRVKKHIPFNQFQDLILGQLQHKIEKLIPPHEKLLVDLKMAVNLRCLTLLNVQIRDVEFVKLIHQNPQLHTLYLEYCHDVTENGLAQAVKGSKVVNFCIKQCPQIHGSFLEELANTRIFIMDHANRDIRYDVFRSFSKLNSLQYLNLFGNIHFNDGILASMRPCGHSLRSLNIGYTSITKYFSQSMKYFTNLETLCLDDSRVPMRSVLEALGEARGIEKLSVCGFNGGNERAELTIVQLNEIGNILHNLTHLCIKYCYKLKGIPELNNFKNLKIVEIDARGDQQLIECFQSAGVIVLQDQE